MAHLPKEATISTEQQSLVSLTINTQNFGIWDKRSGGDGVSKEIKYRPGGMGPEETFTSLPSYTTVTLSRVMEFSRDWELFRAYEQQAGKLGASISEQPLDASGNPYGNPIVWQGRFLGFKPGNVDSTSDAVRMIEVDIAVITMT